jgi:hypothetical protein
MQHRRKRGLNAYLGMAFPAGNGHRGGGRRRGTEVGRLRRGLRGALHRIHLRLDGGRKPGQLLMFGNPPRRLADLVEIAPDDRFLDGRGLGVVVGHVRLGLSGRSRRFLRRGRGGGGLLGRLTGSSASDQHEQQERRGGNGK